MDVGVRELKQHLSEYLDRAAGGELIRVTDRGTPKALITPLPAADRIEQGIDEGWIKEPSRPRLDPFQARRSTRKVADVLDEDRGE